MKRQLVGGEQSQADIRVGGEIKSGHIEQETAADVRLQKGKFDRLEGLEKLKNTGKMTLKTMESEQKITYQKGEQAFKTLQNSLDRDSKEFMKQIDLLSKEEIADQRDRLQRDLTTEKIDAKIFIANINNDAKKDIAELKSLGAEGAKSKGSAVEGLN